MRNMSIENIPPFEKDSDKGFKDAYIFFTILEYWSNNKSENIFAVTKDKRLKQALIEDKHIRVVSDFNEFEKYIDLYFKEQYFIDRLKEEIDKEIEFNWIDNIWINTEENWVLKLASLEKKYFIEVDFVSKEILVYTDFDFSKNISNLINAGTFSIVHDSILILKDFVHYFSNDEIQNLIKAATENEQIYWIATDLDVKDFFISIYKSKEQIFSEDIKEVFEAYFYKIK